MLIALIILHLAVQAALAFAILRFKDHIKLKLLWVLALFAGFSAWTFWGNDSAYVLKHFPNKYAVIVCDLFPLIVTGLFALLISARPSRLRFCVYGVLWVAMNGYFFSGAVYSPIQCKNEWSGICCLQTDNRTCGAAAAATLLKINGINSTEEEMKRACLTSFNGTSYWGLYHGLREKADGAGKTVEADDLSCAEFIARNQPAVVWVMLTKEVDAADKRYSTQWGWVVNVSHAVVFLGIAPDGRLKVADPKIGIELWHPIGMQALWRNKVVFLR